MLRNYWGYNTLGFFAPYQGYSSTGTLGQQTQEFRGIDRKSTRLNSSHTEIYTLSLHDALPIYAAQLLGLQHARLLRALPGLLVDRHAGPADPGVPRHRSEEHTSELQSHRDLHSFPTRRSSDLCCATTGATTRSASSRPTRATRRPARWASRPRSSAA